MSKSQLETLLHFHTENSRYDSVAKIKSMCLRAKELGCSAMGITEHGVLTSTYDFMDICKELDIKPIPGVEIYVGDRASHMCLYPKSQKGYIVISKLVSESFQSMTIDKTTKKKKNTKPIVSEDMLVYFLGENGEGHNEVIATSGCIGGVLCNELNYNAPFLKEVSSKKADFEKFMNKNAKNIPENYEEIYKKVQNQKEQLKKINKQLTQTKKDAKLKTTREEKTLRAFSETDDGYQNALLKLKEKQDKIDAAKKAIEELTHQKNEMTQYNKKHENIYKNIEKFIDKQNTLNETIDKITRNLLSLNDCYDRALKKAQWLLNILGEGNFYIELQYHGIPLEAQLMPQILQIAQELHIPYIVTNDAHMVSNSEKEIEAREYIRSMRYPDTFYPIDEYDKELYIKTDEELSSMLLEIFDEKVIQNGFAGCKELVDKCNVTLSKENHYPVYISEKKEENSADCLRRMCQEGIKERFTIDEWTEEYQTRLEYELDVIIRMGYADYHCIVADYLQYGKLIGQIDFNKYEEEYNKNPYDFNYLKELVEKTSGVGEGIGPGRGSAAGSLVCYLIGITDINPIKYNLLFERFLNVERVSMPDIDSDFSPEIREKVINYVRYKYGEDAVCMILTTGRLWARKAIRNVARVYGLKQRGNKLAFSSLADELCSHVPDTIGVRFKDFLYDSSVTDENGDTSLQIGLRTKYQQNPDALKILDIAECLEGVFIDYGMHAAGVIIADNHPVKNYIPLMCNDGVNWVCQCDMIRAEESGMLKMDFLGLKNLEIITNTLRLIQKHTGQRINMQNIDYDDPNVLKIYATGFTNGVFQVESPGMKSINQEFEPKSFEDIILIIAAYRPGPMDFIPDIVAVKKGLKTPNYIIPEMAEVLGTTYGCPVYQEQLMEIFHRFANFSLGQADIVRRYMSKKKVDKFLQFKDDFVKGFVANGAKKEDAENYWNDLVNFAKYAFNKSHAAAYAVVSYQTAWLKCYYPREYFCAYIDSLDTKNISMKIKGISSDLGKLEYHIIAPDINLSNAGFDLYNENLIYGLNSIRSVKDGIQEIIQERKTNGPFTSIYNLIERITPSKKTLTGLIYSGCFDKLHPNRLSLMKPDLIEQFAAVSGDLRKALLKEDNTKQKELLDELYKIKIDTNTVENVDELLTQEKFYLGGYFSQNPLQSLPIPEEIKCISIEKLTTKTTPSICGIISDLRIVKRKKDNADMAFFVLEDNSGNININCFSSAYAQFKSYIYEGSKIKITGKVTSELDFGSDPNDEEPNYILKLTVKEISPITSVKEDIILPISNIIEWHEKIQYDLTPYLVEHGHRVVLLDKLTGRLRPTIFSVNDDFHPNFS